MSAWTTAHEVRGSAKYYGPGSAGVVCVCVRVGRLVLGGVIPKERSEGAIETEGRSMQTNRSMVW
jgi:hypothetical protein